MRKIRAGAAAFVLGACLTVTAPVEADESETTCEVSGSATCWVPTCEEEAVFYQAHVDQLERRVARAERRIERKNATIERLREALRSR